MCGKCVLYRLSAAGPSPAASVDAWECSKVRHVPPGHCSFGATVHSLARLRDSGNKRG